MATRSEANACAAAQAFGAPLWFDDALALARSDAIDIVTICVKVPERDPPQANGGLLGAAANVAEVYAALARDITENAWTVPGFAHAAQLTRLIAAVTRAAQDGRRQGGRTAQGA